VNVEEYLAFRTAPQVVFDHLEERKAQTRFVLPDGTKVTWQQFADEIRDVALYLRTELGSGDRAAIFAPNSVQWSSASLAIQAAGGAMVPIYGSSTAEQAGYVVEHSGAKVVFVASEKMLGEVLKGWPMFDAVRRIVLLDDSDPKALAAKLEGAPSEKEIEQRFVSWERVRSAGGAQHREAPEAFGEMLDAIDFQQPAVMLYTSGTSGPPKGVPLTHHNVGMNGRDWLEVMAPVLEEGYTDLLWLPMSHIFGYGEVGIGNQLGWTSVMTDPYSVVEKLPEVKPHVFFSVPSVWEKLVVLGDDLEGLKKITGGNLKFCLSGGAGLKRQVKERYLEAGMLILEGYGLTECSPTLTLNHPGDYRFDTVGKALPSVELKLAEDGEILAKGPNVFAGYHGNPEATAECFTEDGWLKTGDIGRFTDDGFLQIIDRKKDILVTAGGKNVAPANIELRFRDDPDIAHVVVYGDSQKYLVAGVWLHPTSRADEAKVQSRIDAVNAELARYETIKKFALIEEPLSVENGLLTPTMKVKRKKVYERFGERLAALY